MPREKTMACERHFFETLRVFGNVVVTTENDMTDRRRAGFRERDQLGVFHDGVNPDMSSWREQDSSIGRATDW